ncbi:MAG: hypothetical protein KF866_05245 [Phycisphaeraceae bacterium]|nr:hypothetical protein [Phycisphaeraceae bacterium]MCW5754399.1 hypothetical protein [Phycisphaeraceae bacterium]
METNATPSMTGAPIVPSPKSGSARRRGASPEQIKARRELFWYNVIREMLTALSVMRIERETDVYDPAAEENARQMFDGRLAVITSHGARIPIAEVHPMFACSVSTSLETRELSEEVQCTVFQIRTPGGEVYTLPLHEIRSFHTLTPELLQRIEEQARQQEEARRPREGSQPFGFAAFTSLSRGLGPAGDGPFSPQPDEGGEDEDEQGRAGV